MIADDNLEQKSEEDQFVVIDEDLDNDLVYRVDDLFVLVDEDSDLVTGHAHAVAFYRVDPQLEQTPSAVAATSSQPLTPSKMSVADDDAAKKTEVRSVDD